MERLYDYNFPSTYTNDHFIPSSGPTHVAPSQISTQPAQAPIALPTHFDYHTTAQLLTENQCGVPTLQFRLPLLTQTHDYASDFQASAQRIHSAFPSWCSPSNVWRPGQLGNGLGAISQTSRAAAVSAPLRVNPVPVPLSVPLTVPVAYEPQQHAFSLDRASSLDFSAAVPLRQHPPGPTTSSLLLEDICHVGPTHDPFASDHSGSSSFRLTALQERTASTGEKAYSECPAAEFSAPSWSTPPPLPSPYCASLSGSTSYLGLSPKKEPLEDYLCLSPLPASAAEDSFGPAPLLGIYADINMRERAVREQSPSVCVNPADIMGKGYVEPNYDFDSALSIDECATPSSRGATPALGTSYSQAPGSTDRQLSHTPDFTVDFPEGTLIESNFSEEAISAIVSVLTSSTKQEAQEPSINFADTDVAPHLHVKPSDVVAPKPLYPNQMLGYPPDALGIHHPSLAPGGARATFPGPRIPLADIQQQQIQQIQVPHYDAYAPFGFTQAAAKPAPPPPPASPVLNAHTGIELDDLRRRATDFRTRNPGLELDRTFLQCFAGRLSERGELLDEYRCYVVGCGQRNKRRDHILVHVGSHVEHRPWQCQHCGMRFLRKNECKRHESSHGGRKPFSCPICAPFQDRSFVRQDLLKRHMRVTHGVHDTRPMSLKRRMENRKEQDGEGWP